MAILRSLILCAFLLTPTLVCAQNAASQHVTSAFIFAHRSDWSEAITHARESGNPVLVKYFTWLYLKDPQSGAPFDAIADFMQRNPDWPDQSVLQKRAEVALLASNPSDAQLNAWFAKHPPQTHMAKLKSAKNTQQLQDLIRETWVNDDYDKKTEQALYEKYHSMLRGVEHARRIDRLLWEGKDDEAKRLLPLVDYDNRLLFQARISLMNGKQRAAVDVVNVPPQLKNDPGLLFNRIEWRIRQDDRDGVRELLVKAPAEVPYPERWWPIRDRQIRQAIGENNPQLALSLLAHHGQVQGTVQYKEVEFLNGWIELMLTHHADKAYSIFSALSSETLTPSGKARAAYWTARAAEASNKGTASRWFSQGARYPTTFYGQLCLWELNHGAALSISQSAHPSAQEKEHFSREELVQLVYALGRAGESDAAAKFITYLAENAADPAHAMLAANLGREINRVDLSVHAAKKILNNDIVSLDAGYPVLAISSNAVEKPLMLGLMRQESQFLSNIVSPSGAIGMMQLLPRTAKETAHKSHLSYSTDRLYEPNYNMTIGAIYLNKMIEKFGGSYVYAIASYNAGPGRVQQWLSEFGAPASDNPRNIVDWIEKIPNSETRNYVQHVLENTEVYRFMLAGRIPVKLKLVDDLVR